MRSLTRPASLLGLTLGLVSVLSCSNETNQPASADIGSIGFELQLAPGVTVSVVSWSIINAATAFSRSGNVNVQFSNTVRFQVGGLPAAAGYNVTLSATSVGGALTCTGSAPFDIMAGASTAVSVNLACSPAGGGGSGNAVINGTTLVCANINSISVFPLETAVNTAISLSATATAGATFAWTAPAGTFDNAASATPVFTCPATPGDVTITLTVSPSAAGCTTVTTQSVVVTCDTLNPTFTNVYTSIIAARCTGCHRPGGSGVTVGLLDMSTPAVAYAALVGIPAAGVGAGTSGVTCASQAPGLLRVAASNSAASLLFNKVNSKLTATPVVCGSPMPLPAASPPLTAAQVNLLAAWIDAGAAND